MACTAAELNYGLAQFVKEITRPNGERYEPDSIYYLCLGIQQVREGLLPQVLHSQIWGSDLVWGTLYPLFCLLGTKRGSLNSPSVPCPRAAAHLIQSLFPSPVVGWQLFPSFAHP